MSTNNTTSSSSISLNTTTAVSSKVVYTGAEQIECLAIILVFGTFGGFLIQSIQGFSMGKLGKFPGFTVKPWLKTIKIPPLVGMIIFGMIARNFFGPKMLAYNSPWTGYLKFWCYCTLLIRAGLNLDPRGRILTTLLMTIVPQQVEASLVAWMAYGLFGMPVSVCYALGYLLACVSPSVTVPALISLTQQGYGSEKFIP